MTDKEEKDLRRFKELLTEVSRLSDIARGIDSMELNRQVGVVVSVLKQFPQGQETL